VEEQEGEREISWETARVVFGRLVGINKNANEITIETEGEDGEWFEEDYDLPEDFAKDQFEELIDYLDLDVRVVLLDSTVIKIVCGGRLR
jgi:phosphopantothenoylcysteine synthetase/decarboxylase